MNVALANKKPQFVIKGLETFCLFRSFPWTDEALRVSTSCWKVEFQARVRETSSSSRSERGFSVFETERSDEGGTDLT